MINSRFPYLLKYRDGWNAIKNKSVIEVYVYIRSEQPVQLWSLFIEDYTMLEILLQRGGKGCGF